MCIIPGDKMAEAMRDETQRVDVMTQTMRGIDAFFAPHLARAEAQAAKIAKVAQAFRDMDDDDADPFTTQVSP